MCQVVQYTSNPFKESYENPTTPDNRLREYSIGFSEYRGYYRNECEL